MIYNIGNDPDKYTDEKQGEKTMEEHRPNPQQLLRSIQNEQDRITHGKLKIFFGYAAGVGKTYTMLEAAQQAKRNGKDVVVGYVEPHLRPDTMALLAGLEQLPCKEVMYKGVVLHEFDLDAALSRKPQLILVDELAHSNAAAAGTPSDIRMSKNCFELESTFIPPSMSSIWNL